MPTDPVDIEEEQPLVRGLALLFEDSFTQSHLFDLVNGMEEHRLTTKRHAIVNSPAPDDRRLQSIVSGTDMRALYDSRSRNENEDKESGDVNAAVCTSNGDCNRTFSILGELASACGSLLDPSFKENFEQALLREREVASTNSTDVLQNEH